jgi:Ca2+-binding RTX toxin-like protein
MSDHVVTGDSHKQLAIKTSNSTWTIAKQVQLTVKDDIAILVDTNYKNNVIDILGDITSTGNGIPAVAVLGDDNTVTVESSSKITGFYGMAGLGTIINHGTILADNTAIETAGQATVTNSGSIISKNGDAVTLEDGTFTNQASGEVSGGIRTVANGSPTVINKGTISAEFTVSNFGHGDLKVINSGTLDGNVDLGLGTATLDTRHGAVHGIVYGSYLDTVYLVSDASLAIQELSDGGNDTVKSTVSFTLADNFENLTLLGKADIDATGNTSGNHINGNAGNNTLLGDAGLDYLNGGKGNDILTGGDDQDNFIFAQGSGVDTITDFTHGADYVDILKFAGITDYDSLTSHISQHGADTWIALGHGDKLILQGIDSTTLTKDDFVFA